MKTVAKKIGRPSIWTAELEDAVIADFRKQIADIECDFEEEAEAESRRYDALGDDDESVE